MAANYLHGVETIRVSGGGGSVKVVKSAVTALVGTAPIGPVNALTLVASDVDAAQFGPDIDGFGIARALAANLAQGRPSAGIVLVVNVLDPSVHKTVVTGEALAFDANTDLAMLANPAASGVVIKSANGQTTYTAGTDYTLTAVTGKVVRLATGGIARGATVSADYTYADPTKITSADIIGAVDAAGIRTGMQAWLTAFSLFGFNPKRLIAPGYSPLASVASEMGALAARLNARAYIDAPIGTTPAQVIAGRGPAGTITAFQTSNGRVRLCYPHVKIITDDTTGAFKLEPLSQYVAGVGNAVDIAHGYQYSVSNHEIYGISGAERLIAGSMSDPNGEINLLNEVGITTILNSFGTGNRVYGNRMASWPASTEPVTFESVLAVDDIVAESIEYYSAQFLDKPGTQPWIDAIVEAVNGFIRKLVGDNALIDGKCWFDTARNPVSERALGHYTFSRDLMPPTPGERITHETTINIKYLANLK